jgi:adenine-specific DNA-methyltransferase
MGKNRSGRKPKSPGRGPTPLTTVKHKDTRPNIPTREQGAMVTADEAAPKDILYTRDPSLDPQLVWKGKDKLDAKPLDVPSVPIYIQEKIHPQAIVEDLRKSTAAAKAQQLDLFADFNGLNGDPAKRTEFYRHDQHWTNRLILGDSLLVMTSLAEKERLKGRVQTIYVDPPYGIKFGSNWQVSTRQRDVKDAKANDLTRQPEQVKAFRDTWQLGIHSYLTYLRDRLTVARELLTESGSVFVQIGDENVHLVRSLLDEVFGSENFASLILFATTSGFPTGTLSRSGDYLLWYAKDISRIKYRQLFRSKNPGEEGAAEYKWLMLPDGSTRSLTEHELSGQQALPEGSRRWRYGPLTSSGIRQETSKPFVYRGKTYSPGRDNHWKIPISGLAKLASANLLIERANSLAYYLFADHYPLVPITNNWLDTKWGFDAGDKLYVVQTNTKVIERCLLMTTDPGDLVLDPTCGSGTTAYVAEQWGRRWITVDTSRVALTLARTRMMAARFPYYLLADSAEGRRKEAELTGVPPADGPTERDIRKGFVYKRVPHVTLKSIANNPDIREGMSSEQTDAAIRRHAETETLYDLPYEDKNVVRVTGPLTVESLSPHRVLPAQNGAPGGQAAPGPEAAGSSSDFVARILDNLHKAGVQNTKRGERLVFDGFDPYPGEFLQAAGTYTEREQTKRAAVCIGPEFGTVGPELLADAAREAHRGLGFDLLLVCGFAFDPHVAEEGKVIEKQVGRLKVLLVRMNPDLAMGEELLKKTGAGNLFMVFGEPDLDIQKQEDGKFVVEVRGVDVFDPTTGEIRSSGPEDIACWFIDTDYNGESFFVRHAYFFGEQEPYEKLKRALRADIDEAAWGQLYSNRSMPFEAPKKGKIAVKVINHYGDEVLKVYRVPDVLREGASRAGAVAGQVGAGRASATGAKARMGSTRKAGAGRVPRPG